MYNITFVPKSVKLSSKVIFRPMYSNRSIAYIVSFVAKRETVFPVRPALAVLPDLWMKILGFGGKSY